MTLNNVKRKTHTTFGNQLNGFQLVEKHIFKYDQTSDSEGLKRAYKHGDYYIHGETMFIARSHTARDWFGDFTKIPVWGDLKDLER